MAEVEAAIILLLVLLFIVGFFSLVVDPVAHLVVVKVGSDLVGVPLAVAPHVARAVCLRDGSYGLLLDNRLLLHHRLSLHNRLRLLWLGRLLYDWLLND